MQKKINFIYLFILIMGNSITSTQNLKKSMVITDNTITIEVNQIKPQGIFQKFLYVMNLFNDNYQKDAWQIKSNFMLIGILIIIDGLCYIKEFRDFWYGINKIRICNIKLYDIIFFFIFHLFLISAIYYIVKNKKIIFSDNLYNIIKEITYTLYLLIIYFFLPFALYLINYTPIQNN
jgi:hypothetical protein